MARGSRVGAGGIRCGGPRASGSGGSASRSPIVVPAAACAAVAAMVVVAGVAWIPLTGPRLPIPRSISAKPATTVRGCARTWATLLRGPRPRLSGLLLVFQSCMVIWSTLKL
jgi:hypothetical protein